MYLHLLINALLYLLVYVNMFTFINKSKLYNIIMNSIHNNGT